MSETKFRVPSRTVKYGYVDVSMPYESEDLSPEMVAAHYVSYVYAFQKEEEAAIERLQADMKSDRVASALAETVADEKAIRAPLPASESEVDRVIGETLANAQKLAQAPSEGYSEEGARRLLEEGLGASVVEASGIAPWDDSDLPEYKVGDKVTVGGIEFTKHSEAPWEQKVEAKLKPWEAGNLPPEAVVTAPAVLDAAW